MVLNVYAKQEVLTREVLARECNSPDLPEEMRWEVVFLPSEHESPNPDPKAKLTEDQQVAGWSVTSTQAGEIRSAFLRNDRQTLGRLYQAGVYGQVDLFLATSGSDEWDVNDPDCLEGIPKEYQAVMGRATCRYSLETHASRNNISLDLQQFLWRMIGALTYGLLEDPQEGEYEDCAEDESTA
jgi:hypothetical protein